MRQWHSQSASLPDISISLQAGFQALCEVPTTAALPGCVVHIGPKWGFSAPFAGSDSRCTQSVHCSRLGLGHQLCVVSWPCMRPGLVAVLWYLERMHFMQFLTAVLLVRACWWTQISERGTECFLWLFHRLVWQMPQFPNTSSERFSSLLLSLSLPCVYWRWNIRNDWKLTYLLF